MQWRRHVTGLAFSLVFVVSYFTNKVGTTILLLVSGKLGWVEINRITRSAALSWLPGSLLFVGNIYAGSRALSRLDIPFFFTLQNCSHPFSYVIFKVIRREVSALTACCKLIRSVMCFTLLLLIVFIGSK
uniref:Uncharacterized protein n=1 Tax=Neolamprologus brichardi TaxID=32507 RepID=A0A3Q4GZF9_NEOBR